MSKATIPFENWRAEIEGSRACILVDRGATTLHIWVDPETLEIARPVGKPNGKPTLYVNMKEPAPGERPKMLDAYAQANCATTDSMIRQAPALIAQARERQRAENTALADARAESARIGMIERAGPSLLAALEPLAMAARAQADALEKEAMLMNAQPREVILGAARRWRGLEDEARRAIWEATHGEKPMSDADHFAMSQGMTHARLT